MIVDKVKIPSKSLRFMYNKEFDILDIFIDNIVSSFSEENYYGVYVRYDYITNEIVGLSINDYTKRNRDFIQKYLPFNLDFNYIDKNVVN